MKKDNFASVYVLEQREFNILLKEWYKDLKYVTLLFVLMYYCEGRNRIKSIAKQDYYMSCRNPNIGMKYTEGNSFNPF